MRFFLVLGETTLRGSCTIPDSEIFLILAYGRPAHNPPQKRYGIMSLGRATDREVLTPIGGRSRIGFHARLVAVGILQ